MISLDLLKPVARILFSCQEFPDSQDTAQWFALSIRLYIRGPETKTPVRSNANRSNISATADADISESQPPRAVTRSALDREIPGFSVSVCLVLVFDASPAASGANSRYVGIVITLAFCHQ
jgi:hypothetical protein